MTHRDAALFLCRVARGRCPDFRTQWRTVKALKIHPKALEFLRAQSGQIRREVGEALRDLQKGLSLGMPLSRPMPTVAPGAYELRVKDATTTVRVIYIARIADAIVVFHAFQKKTMKTPQGEIETAQRRLREMSDAKS